MARLEDTVSTNMTRATGGNRLSEMLLAAKAKLRDVTAKHLPPDRLVRLALAAVNRTPKLLECRPETVLLAVFVAGRLGLEPDGILGQAYLVPYGSDCQLVIGYRGLISLARRSGAVKRVEARVVREGDEFAVELGTEARIVHRPTAPDDAPWTHVYAVAAFEDGEVQFDAMSRAEVMRIKSRSRASGNGPWVTDEIEMAKKTVIRRLAKLLPMSVEFGAALALSAGDEAGESRVIDAAQALEVAPFPAVEGEASARPAIEATVGKSLEEIKAEAKAKAAVATAPSEAKP